MGFIASHARRFFHPAVIEEMLSEFVPLLDGTKLDVSNLLRKFSPSILIAFQTILASQYYLTTFLPLSHPQSYLPMLFRTWESINSYMYDERMLHFISWLAEMHVSPEVSDPRKILEIPDDERSEGEGRPRWPQEDIKENTVWPGLYKDVGIFTEHEWHLLMCKCLASMGML
jgi:proteasome activator subunit 4